MAAVSTIALPITELTFTAGDADQKDKFYSQRPKHFIQIMADSPVKVIPTEVFQKKFIEIIKKLDDILDKAFDSNFYCRCADGEKFVHEVQFIYEELLSL